MKNLLILSFLLPLATLAQFKYPTGSIVGNQTVISVPVSLPAFNQTAQALVYYPDDYFLPKNAGKKYPLFLFLHGAGEGKSATDISELNNTGLPQAISQGLKPYGIDQVTGDTVKFIVVSPHCAGCNGSYSYPQLQYTIPYLIANYRIDTTCIWAGGLSSGGSCTWSLVMSDTTFAKKITGIMPESNGGYDNNLAALYSNLGTAAKNGLSVLTLIGSQDPGNNAGGFQAYQALMKKMCLPGHYFDSIPLNLAHVPTVWQQPWPLTARVWSKTMNSWTQMWSLRKGAGTVKPPTPVSVPHAVISVDSPVINYPNSVVHISGAGSYATNGKIVANDWFEVSGPSAAILTSCDSAGYICVSGLRPGNYRFKLVVTDSVGNQDSAFVNFQMNGAPACPICPVCPAPRTVTAVQVNINGIVFSIPLAGTKITYSDGSTQ